MKRCLDRANKAVRLEFEACAAGELTPKALDETGSEAAALRSFDWRAALLAPPEVQPAFFQRMPFNLDLARPSSKSAMFEGIGAKLMHHHRPHGGTVGWNEDRRPFDRKPSVLPGTERSKGLRNDFVKLCGFPIPSHQQIVRSRERQKALLKRLGVFPWQSMK